MRFDDRFLDELKSRLRPSDVIGRTVKLKRQGREFVGLSPFTKEKSPSFFVNDDKGFFHDFSSGKHGDIISFLQETERLSFVEAVQRLAGEAGMALPAPDPQAAEREQKRQGLADWMDLAQKWFAANLRRSTGKAAREMLERRGLPEDQWDRFGLGYAPNDREGLKNALVQRGAKPSELVEAGLLIAPEGGGAPYDRFRDRLIFPIHDGRGRIVSFGGRAMNPDDRAKYLNGPETTLFHKGAILYGLPEARRILGTGSKSDAAIVVVEGYMDVIACQRAGIPAVAPMGTALTEEQMALLWRVSAEPVLCFDGDNAGQRAAGRAVERALPLLKPGRSFRFALLTGGQDPDDILRDKGAPALRNALAETRPFSEMVFERERDAEPLDTPERKAGLKRRLRQAAQAIQDPDLAEQYRRDLFDRFDGLFPRQIPYSGRGRGVNRAGAGWLERMQARSRQTPEGAQAQQAISRSLEPKAASLLLAAIEDPGRLDDHLEEVTVFGFGDNALSPVIAEMVRLKLMGQIGSGDVMRRRLMDAGYEILLSEVDRAAAKSNALFLRRDISIEQSRTEWLSIFGMIVRFETLQAEIKAATTVEEVRVLPRLKAERDALRKAFSTSEAWGDSIASG